MASLDMVPDSFCFFSCYCHDGVLCEYCEDERILSLIETGEFVPVDVDVLDEQEPGFQARV